MISIDFICPACQTGLQPKGRSYRCPGCSKEYPFYLIDGVHIVDFKSLDVSDCECNRDGRTVCKIELGGPALGKRGQAGRDYAGLMPRLVREGFGRGHRILDLGCGEGPYSSLFAAQNEAYGLDTCPERLLLGEDNAIGKGYRTLIIGDGLSLPFADGSFDIVLCTELIEHVVEVRRLIAEVNRVLRKGGRLVLSTPNLVNLGNRLGMVLGKGLKFNLLGFRRGGFYPLTSWPLGNMPGKQYSFDSIRYPEQPLHYRFFTFESLRRLLGYSGFEVREEMGRGPLFSRFPPLLSRAFRNWADDLLVVAVKV